MRSVIASSRPRNTSAPLPQTTLLGFAIGLILALLAALIGPHIVDWNNHRAFIESEASRLVGVPVRVGGDIDAALLPFPSVTLRDIAIGPEQRRTVRRSRCRARTRRTFHRGAARRGVAGLSAPSQKKRNSP